MVKVFLSRNTTLTKQDENQSVSNQGQNFVHKNVKVEINIKVTFCDLQ